MRQTQLIMGMPITLEIVGADRPEAAMAAVYDYFRAVDARYSTYKNTSEITQINQGLPAEDWSEEMKAVLALCEQTKAETDGYFEVRCNNQIDPSGLVKGWAINNAAKLLLEQGVQNFYIDAGGDIQVHGMNAEGTAWRVGIRNPFNRDEIIKVITVSGEGVATSGTAIRGQHIYNPLAPDSPLEDVKSLTVVGPNIYEADRFATAAFAMGRKGIEFIEARPDLEGYAVDSAGLATLTSGFGRYLAHA
jgi:thiamine biosynthesis lipoprotein